LTRGHDHVVHHTVDDFDVVDGGCHDGHHLPDAMGKPRRAFVERSNRFPTDATMTTDTGCAGRAVRTPFVPRRNLRGDAPPSGVVGGLPGVRSNSRPRRAYGLAPSAIPANAATPTV
jgi:hypothetical protein